MTYFVNWDQWKLYSIQTDRHR